MEVLVDERKEALYLGFVILERVDLIVVTGCL
jgi:hypothetical protein